MLISQHHRHHRRKFRFFGCHEQLHSFLSLNGNGSLRHFPEHEPFLLPHAQQPEEALEEKKKADFRPFWQYQRTENLRLLICAACGICFSAGVFYNLVVFLRPMGEPAPLMLTLLFGIGGLLAIAFLNLPLEKDIYQAFLLVVPFLLLRILCAVEFCTANLRAYRSSACVSVLAFLPCIFSW